MTSHCVFCKLDSVKERVVGETENTVAILSNPSLVKGHVLVIPKRHVEKLSELNKQEITELMEHVVKIQEGLLKKFKGCDIRQNYRPFQKEDRLKVNHLHIHIQPRELFDELYEKCQIHEKDIFQDLNESDLGNLMSEVFEK